MRISVVIIVFNLESYIDDAIQSVLRQTRQADEIIVVDDCSTDRSADRVKAYGDKIHYLRMPENSGALLAALTGVRASTSDVISMLDGDDLWTANKLEVVQKEFQSNPELVLLSHDHVRVDENGVELPIRDETHKNIASVRARSKTQHELSELLKRSILFQQGYWLGSAYSFRRDSFDIRSFEKQLTKFDHQKLRMTYLDLVIAPFLVLQNKKGQVGYSPDTSFFYRIHSGGSLSGNFTPEKAIASAMRGRAVNELIYIILDQNGASDDILERRKLILKEYDFLVSLYSHRRWSAVRDYAMLTRLHWNWDQWKKETKRLLAVSILGARRFLQLKAKLSA